ncbi:hypothetical protein ACVOZ6_003463 [Escherichia coli]
MSNDNYILTEEDQKFLAPSELRKWANYVGDHEVLLAKRAMARKLLLVDNPAMDADNLQAWLDSPVGVLDGSARLMNVLNSCAFRTIRQVYEAGSDYLMRQNNFGLRCRDDLADIFRDHGLILRSQPTSAPLPRPAVDDAPEHITVTMPLKLLSDMVSACHHNLAHYERQHGRFASRGKQKPEHDRLMALVEAAERLIEDYEERD